MAGELRNQAVDILNQAQAYGVQHGGGYFTFQGSYAEDKGFGARLKVNRKLKRTSSGSVG